MTLQLNKNSVCELMYVMRDAMEANNIGVAIYLSRQIHDKLLQMVRDKEDINCHLECGIKEK